MAELIAKSNIKHNGTLYKEGQKLTASEAQAEALIEAGSAITPEQKKVEAQVESGEGQTEEEKAPNRMTKAELIAAIEARNEEGAGIEFDKKWNKAQLLSALESAGNDEEADEDEGEDEEVDQGTDGTTQG